MNLRIVAFQKLFQMDYIDREATWYMGWIYPGYDVVDDKLPKISFGREKVWCCKGAYVYRG